MSAKRPSNPVLPTPAVAGAPFVHATRRTRALHFSMHEVQSLMWVDEPDRLILPYTRLMMAVLRWCPRPARLGLVGVGGGSLVKFCHRYLGGCRIDAAEISAEVLALRREFDVPDDDARLATACEDGTRWVRRFVGAFDILLLDGYDRSGLATPLATQRFYDDARAALAPGGWLVANLNNAHPDHETHLQRLRRSLAGLVMEVREPEVPTNSIVFACAAPDWPALAIGPDDAPPIAAAAWATLAAELELVRRAHEAWVPAWNRAWKQGS